MSFIELLRKSKAEGLGLLHGHTPASPVEHKRPWIEQLRRSKAEAAAGSGNSWRVRLERVRGKVGYDGIERISTHALFDELEVPQRGRSAGACRRLAKLMRDLGWTSVKSRSLGQGGFRGQVRGYARDAKGSL